MGDVITGGLSSWIIYQSYRRGVPKFIILRMMLNVLLDVMLGAIPIFGDLFDFMFKANLRNVALIRAHFGAPTQPGALLPAVIPQAALQARRVRPATRYALAALIVIALLALASGPFVLLYLLLRSFA